jgi:beta-lactam-binding protein with PASTA domain
MPADVIERATRRLLSRRALIVVPMVIGMSWADARQALLDKGLTAVGPDPDAPPLLPLDWSRVVVTDQSPESGAQVPAGSAVTLWTERGGGSGVREPRRPKPVPRQARGMRDEVSDEAVG